MGVYRFSMVGKRSYRGEIGSPSDKGSSDIIEYRVYRSTDSSLYKLLASTKKTDLIDATVRNSLTYYYAVTAINNVGESALSTSVNATPVSTTTETISSTINSSSKVPTILITPGYTVLWIAFPILLILSVIRRKKYEQRRTGMVRNNSDTTTGK